MKLSPRQVDLVEAKSTPALSRVACRRCGCRGGATEAQPSLRIRSAPNCLQMRYSFLDRRGTSRMPHVELPKPLESARQHFARAGMMQCCSRQTKAHAPVAFGGVASVFSRHFLTRSMSRSPGKLSNRSRSRSSRKWTMNEEVVSPSRWAQTPQGHSHLGCHWPGARAPNKFKNKA